MAHTFEMRDWRRLRGVKGLEATEPGAWAALHWAPPPFRVLGGGVMYHRLFTEAWREAGA